MPRSFKLRLVAVILFAVTLTSSAADLPKSVGFVTNVGQWPAHVVAAAHAPGMNVWLTQTGVVVDEFIISADRVHGNVIEETFPGAVVSLDTPKPTGATVTYFRGKNDGNKGLSAEVFQSLAYQYEDGTRMAVEIAENGSIQRRFLGPSSNEAFNRRIIRRGDAKHTVNDATRAQSFVYGSYFGGNGFDAITAMDVLPNGNVLVAGTTDQMEYPAGLGGYSKTIKADVDAFVLMCDPKFQRVLAMTFFGGSGTDRVRALTRDAQNNVYLAIETNSSDMPTSPAAQYKTLKAGVDAFVVRFDSTLTKLLTAFYHGGNRDDFPRGIAVDESGNIYIAGGTTSTLNFPNNMPPTANVTWQYQDGRDTKTTTVSITSGNQNMGQLDGFIAIYSATGSMQKSRFYGREGNEMFTRVAIDSRGYVVLTGTTTSSSFEAVPVAHPTWSGRQPYDRSFNGGTTDGFVLKLSSGLTLSQTDGITFATLFGGNREDEPVALWIDDDGKIFVGGNTTSTNYPTTGAIFSTPLGRQDGYVAQIADNGTQILNCTYIGGSGDDIIRSVRPSQRTSAFLIAGTTSSSDFPMEGVGISSERFGVTDGFFTMMNFSSVSLSSLLGGLQADTVVDYHLDFRGDALLASNTTSANLFVHDSGYQRSNGSLGGYLTKYSPGTLEIVTPKGGEIYCVGTSKPLSWDASGVSDTTKFRIEYARDGSSTWADVVRSTGGRSYLWKIPSNVQPGSYKIRVSTANGHISELITPFMIDIAPTITKQPTSSVVCDGSRLSLSVQTSSVAAKYQWRKDGVVIPGATGSTYTVDAVNSSNAGRYDCVITGDCPPAVTTQIATVSLSSKPPITTNPTSQIVDPGQPVTLSVVATGQGLTYQWFKNEVAIPSATAATLTINSATTSDQGAYFCEVSSGCGTTRSAIADIRVNSGTSVGESNPTGLAMRMIGPNPAQDYVVVEVVLDQSALLTPKVIDLQGRLVAERPSMLLPSGSNRITVSMADCAQGVVMVQFSVGARSVVLPVFIQR
jgi:hypothetical protein